MANQLAIHYKRGCKVCAAIKKNPRLKYRIYQSSAFREDAVETLLDIARDYTGVFQVSSLYNHCKKHQIPNEKKLRTSTLIRLKSERKRQEAIVEQLKKDGKLVEIPRQNFEEVWDTIIDVGAERIRNGELKVTPAMMLKAAKDKADFSSKKQDRSMEMAKMMYGFASGEQTEIIEGEVEDATIAGELTAGSDPGPDGPGDFYPAAVGDAAARGADPLFETDTEVEDADQPLELRQPLG